MPCYTPNGTQITTSDFQPCNNVQGQFSMCCATNKANPDTCLPNGLCKWINNNAVWYYRNSCSDKSWNSPYCLNICKALADEDDKGDAQVSQCDDGTWCCGNDATNSCCQSNNKFALAATVGVTSSTISSTTSTSVSQSHSTTFTSTPSLGPSHSSTPSSTPQGLSTGARAGVGIGVAAGALAVLAGALYLWLRRRRRIAARQEEKLDIKESSMPAVMPAEMDPHGAPVEIPGPESTKTLKNDAPQKQSIRHELA